MSLGFDTSGFDKMIAGLSAVSGKSQEDVLLDQVAQLLSVCIRYTHSADKQSLETSVANRNHRTSIKDGPKLTVNFKRNIGNTWLVDEGEKYLANQHRLPAAKWAKALMLAARLEGQRTDPATARKSRGLTKSSWLQIAQTLGIADRVKAAGWIRGATTFKGRKPPPMGSSERILSGAAIIIEIANSSGLLVNGPSRRFKGNRANLNGWSIIQRAMTTRAKAFQNEMKRGVFSDIEARAKRYPGIFTK